MAKKRKTTHRPAPTGKPGGNSEPTWEKWIREHPALAAMVIFALLTVIFFGVIRPALFSPGKMIYGTDTMGAGVFFRGFYAEFWRAHLSMPLWDPYIHGGMPFVDAMHGDIFYPAALLQVLLPVTYALGVKLILHVFLAGLFMYFFLRDWGLTWRSSVIGGILYMFTPCLISLFYPGHDGKIYVIAWTPLAFMFLRRGTVRRRLSSFLAFGLIYAIMILTAHIQMAYYASWGLGLYFIFLLWTEYKFRPSLIIRPIGAFIMAVLLAGGASAIQWWAPSIYIRDYSQRIQHTEERGFAWSSSWSMHAEEAGSELVPEFPGDNLINHETTYWGQNFFKLNSEAIGLFAIFFALVTLTIQRRRQVLFFAGMAVLAFLYALGAGTPLFTMSYYLIPMVNKFRAPSMINFLFAFGTVAVAAWGINQIERLPAKSPVEKSYFKSAAIIAAIYTGITLTITVWGSGFFIAWADFFQKGVDSEKLQAIRANTPRVITGLWISTFLLWGAIWLIWMRFHRSLKAGLFIGGLAVLALVDLWRFDGRFIMLINPETQYRRTALIDYLDEVKQREGPFRTFLLPQTEQDNYLAMYGLEEVSMSAMHGNHLLSYDNFTGRHESPQNLIYPKFWDLLNITRIVSPLPGKELYEQAGRAGIADLEVIGRELAELPGQPQRIGNLFVYKNPNALPRVAGFFGYRVIDNHEAVLAELKKPDFPYRKLVILEQPIPGFPPHTGSTSALRDFQPGKVIDNQINEFTIDIEMPADGLVVLSENYYPAWHAEEDGIPYTIYRANYTFRAIFVEAGHHTIRFRFENRDFSYSEITSGICLVVLILGLLVTSRRRTGSKPPVDLPA